MQYKGGYYPNQVGQVREFLVIVYRTFAKSQAKGRKKSNIVVL